MSSSILERTRALYEAAELSEQAIAEQLKSKPNGQKAKVWQQHKLCKLMESISADSRLVSDFFDDVNGIHRAEIEQMKGPQMFDTFYSAVTSTQEYYARFPHLNIPSAGTVLPEPEVTVAFSGEEVFGKYLDLHRFFVQFSNLPGLQAAQEELDYLQYLDKFSSFFYISETVKNTKQYRTYVLELSEYLSDFFRRVQPLVNHKDIVETLRSEFEAKWSAGQISGWKAASASNAAAPPQPLRLGMFNSVEELEALGLDRLKQALEAMGLKCGGTLRDRAERLWSVRGKKPEDIPAKLRAPTAAKKAEGEAAETVDLRKQTAWHEYIIISLCGAISDIVTATRRHAVKQQTRTLEEKEAEIAEEEFGYLYPDEGGEGDGKDEGGGDDEPIYNPLNLPLGWDGKPIPFWLYKLHGLGIEYKCEICGNFSYWGRRAFDKHFQEWRHAHGMRCLGIPNTKHFHDITLIEDALALHNKIKHSLKTEQYNSAQDEEFEDSEGNVLNRRTYEDLARQGLL